MSRLRMIPALAAFILLVHMPVHASAEEPCSWTKEVDSHSGLGASWGIPFIPLTVVWTTTGELKLVLSAEMATPFGTFRVFSNSALFSAPKGRERRTLDIVLGDEHHVYELGCKPGEFQLPNDRLGKSQVKWDAQGNIRITVPEPVRDPIDLNVLPSDDGAPSLQSLRRAPTLITSTRAARPVIAQTPRYQLLFVRSKGQTYVYDTGGRLYRINAVSPNAKVKGAFDGSTWISLGD